MVVKAVKAKKSAKPQKARATKEILKEFYAITEARYKMAKAIYEAQDNLTKEVIDRIRDRLRIASTGVVNINGQPHKLEQQYIDFNIWFIATEIISDLYMNNVQVANFVPDPAYCISCKKELFAVKEPKHKRARR